MLSAPTRKWLAIVALAASCVPAATSASVNACIEACASGFMPNHAHCARPDESASPAVATDCCAKPAEDSATHCEPPVPDANGCPCDTCSLAAERFFTQRIDPQMVDAPELAAILPDPLYAPTPSPMCCIDPAHGLHLARGLTRAQLCVYLC